MTFPFFPYFSGNNIHHPTKSAYDQCRNPTDTRR